MDNKERAREISESFYRPETGYNDEELYMSAMAMAEWKDEQFKEEKKELLGLVKMIKVDEHNQTIIEDLVAMLNL